MAKTIKTGAFYRSAEFDRAAIDEKARTVSLSFSSEQPVERYFGIEILDHNASSVNLDRLNNGGALLVDHDTADQVGVCEMASIGPDKKGRATVRFGNSTRAQEIFQDVKDGIRRLISVGYRIDKMVTDKIEKGVETLRATAWTPLEISIVSVPADTSVGIGRADKTQFETRIETMENNTPPPATPPAPPPSFSEAQVREDAIKSFRKTCEEIDGIAKRLEGKVDKIEELAAQARNAGWTVEQFRAEAMNRLPAATPLRNAEPLDVKPKDWARYSIVKAIRGTMPGQKLDGMEREISEEISLRGGKRPEGVWVPAEAMVLAGKRNFIAGTGTLGGMLVQTDNLGSQFIELLRNRALVAKLGARMLSLSNPVTIPRQNAAGSVNWIGETVAATLSAGNFTQLTLTPQGVSAFQQYGKQLLFENDPSVDALVRDDIMNIIALEIDRVCLHGLGSAGQPTGITATTGVTTIALGANGAAFSVANARAAVISLETAVSVANADVGNLAYVTNAKMRGRLKVIDQSQATNTARWVWENDGTMNSYSAQVTQQVSAIQTQGTATTICSSVFFGNWNDILVASFNNGATDLVVDPYTLAANAVIRVIARHWTDIGIRHPASFAVLLGCLDS
jgi:HK97 family phage major capsid protein/HK97 family phage prohead protease